MEDTSKGDVESREPHLDRGDRDHRGVGVPLAVDPVLLLLGAIELAIIINQGMTVFSGGKMIFIANLAIGAIQLGATVDYAILLTRALPGGTCEVAGHRETAMREALGGTGPSIITSASTMFAATIGLVFLSSVSTITDLTLLIARGAVVSFFVVMFLLPGLLVLAQPCSNGRAIGWPRIPRK